ncbi:MAG TPA: (deoxy)nucleoside triphosphate pyrophosphohydrolase [Armatimonadota bacterium]|nr:(deoxy)nucleoside triphosphate pyrophosphohydrolase [Armatimonadota bacterium]
MTDSIVEVAVAIIIQDGLVLLTRRSPGAHLAGLWEFPGGKIAPGESPEEAVRREVHEETGLVVTPGRLLDSFTHRYPERTVRLHFFECRVDGGALNPGPHEATWTPLERLSTLETPAANASIIDRITGRSPSRQNAASRKTERAEVEK